MTRRFQTIPGALISATALSLLGTAAAAGHLSYYEVAIGDLNSSGVSGSGSFVYDSNAQTLAVNLMATGLFEFERHAAHIHGVVGGDSVSPPVVDADADGFADIDTDKDGYVELLEAASFYGPVMVSLTEESGMFPEVPGGVLNYSRVFDLTDPAIYGGSFDIDDLVPAMLENREIVLHGGYVSGTALGVPGAGTTGEVDGNIGFKAFLPVATGEIYAVAPPVTPPAVPLPASLPLLAAGFGAFGFLARRRRKSA